MSVKRVPPPEAAELMKQGYKYVDVRSIPEFQGGHPPGAYNIPLNHMVPGRGMAPNHELVAAFEKHFAKDAKLLLGCGSGPRSLRAAELLLGIGYTDVLDVKGGWNGDREVAGWREAGLPVEMVAPGRGWEDLKP